MTKLRDSWIDGAMSLGMEFAVRGPGFVHNGEAFISREQFAFESFVGTFIGRIGYWWPTFAAATTAATAACIRGGLNVRDWFSEEFASFKP